jgi:acyl carrier protein
LIDDLDLDSIDAVDMAVRLEEKTGYRFAEEELRSVTTIQDVVDLIDGHQ